MLHLIGQKPWRAHVISQIAQLPQPPIPHLQTHFDTVHWYFALSTAGDPVSLPRRPPRPHAVFPTGGDKPCPPPASASLGAAVGQPGHDVGDTAGTSVGRSVCVSVSRLVG